jgi:hypothetical protein
MSPLRNPQPAWTARVRPPVDDAYTEWFSAHVQCTDSLHAWKTAAWGERAEAHRVYLADLEREEAAARELERLNYDHRAAA